MARKSKAQRVADTQAALPRWRAAARDREVRFMEDMLARIERGQGLSPRQRSWLDELCEAEPPPPPAVNAPLIARAEAAVEHLSSTDANIVRDFTGRLRRGWKLSEKQEAFLYRLLEKAETVALHGPWQPDPITQTEGLFAARIVTGRSSMWRSSHPGTVQAAQRIRYLAGAPADEREQRPLHLEPPDEWCYRKVIEAVGPAVRELRSPRWSEGELAWWGPHSVLISGPVEAQGGAPCYPVLHEGQIRLVPSDKLRKRPPGGA